MKNLLVTGGCGFIGSNFIHLALATYPQLRIVNLDALTYAANPRNLEGLPADSDYHFCQGDICDADLVSRLLADWQIDTVVHFAAESHVDNSIRDSRPFITTNVLGTQVLLEAIRHHAAPIQLLHISTDEVYGPCSAASEGFDTEAPLRPGNPYAASKAAADLLVLSYRQTYGLPVMISRCVNNYGPRQHPEKLIPRLISRAVQDQPLPLYGDGSALRDWLYVEDHCQALLQILTSPQPLTIYHLAAGQEYSALSVAQQVLTELDKPASLLQFIADRPGHDLRYCLDCQATEAQLGRQPRTVFADGLISTIHWYQAHPQWLQR